MRRTLVRIARNIAGIALLLLALILGSAPAQATEMWWGAGH